MKVQPEPAPKEVVRGILDYKNIDAIERYCEESNKPLEYGEEVFLQLMRWLYVGYIMKKERGVPLPIYPEIIELDYMWHSFILFTRDYQAFCDRYFHVFIHHTPATNRDPQSLEGDEYESLRGVFRQTLQSEFGDEALVAWFDEVKYGVRTGEELRLLP